MEIIIETSPPEKLRTGVVVVGAFAGGALSPAARALDEASSGRLSTVIRRGDLDDWRAGSSLLVHDVPGIAAERVLVIGLGKREELGDKTFRDAVGGAARALADGAAEHAAVTRSAARTI